MTQLHIDLHLGSEPSNIAFLVLHPVLGTFTKSHVKLPHGPAQDELPFRIS